MKHLKIILLAATSLTLLSACATSTPYAPSALSAPGTYHPGYSETQIETGRFRISFAGNDQTKRETVENYMLYRAAELTLQSGFDWFEIVNRGTDEKKRTISTPSDPFIGGMSWRFYRGSRWGAWGMGWDDYDRDTVEYTRYEASAEILMHKGDKPTDKANAYGARDVKANLEAKIVRPASK